jgi:hypothetical protein
LFAASDGGAEHWAVIGSLIIDSHPNSRLDKLLPWACPAAPSSSLWLANDTYS